MPDAKPAETSIIQTRGKYVSSYTCDSNLPGDRELTVIVRMSVIVKVEPGYWCRDSGQEERTIVLAAKAGLQQHLELDEMGVLIDDWEVVDAEGFTPKPEWTEELQQAAQRQGWDIFWASHSDYTAFEIEALAEPPEHLLTEAEVEAWVGPFDTPDGVDDPKAIRFVQEQANAGDPTCRAAIEFLYSVAAPDVTEFGLKMPWKAEFNTTLSRVNEQYGEVLQNLAEPPETRNLTMFPSHRPITNADRIDAARTAIQAHVNAVDGPNAKIDDLESEIVDLVTNVRHYIQHTNLDADKIFRLAESHFATEQQ